MGKRLACHTMRLAVACVLGFVMLAGGGCKTAPEPLGEALLIVDTDVAVPSRVDRLRIEVFTSSGKGENTLVDARDVVTSTRDEWPVSFSVVSPDGAPEQDVLVRLRAYPEGHQVSARELEQLARTSKTPRNIAVYTSIEEACQAPPKLVLGQPLTLRRGATKITSLLTVQGCSEETRSGSAVASLEIAEAGDYSVEIVRATPNAADGEPGSDTAISLRTSCPFPTTQLACAEQIGIDNNRLSRLQRVTLAPGKYFVVTGGSDPAPADLTLLASRLDVFQPIPSPPPPLTADPSLLEPSPGVTIDRLVVVRLRAGQRGGLNVVLRGECFGTSSDMTARTSCVDRAGERVPTESVVALLPLSLERAQQEGRPLLWPPETPTPCSVPPRAGGGGPLFDAEVCIPGGAFILGDTLALEDLDRRSQPERMRVVEPFLLDKYEMSVGRFREAVRRGFVSPDGSPVPNPNKVLSTSSGGSMCTWSVGATADTPAPGVDRETLPINCVSWTTARAMCRFLGGDLPEEDQWEFAATRAGRPSETSFPWGSQLPTCDRTVYGRSGDPSGLCFSAGVGPLPINDPLLAAGDVTSLGVVGLGGNIEELLATPFVPYADVAWQRAGLRGFVEEKDAPLRAARGADWSTTGIFTTASTRRAEPVIATYTNVGFRCARRGR